MGSSSTFCSLVSEVHKRCIYQPGKGVTGRRLVFGGPHSPSARGLACHRRYTCGQPFHSDSGQVLHPKLGGQEEPCPEVVH